MIYSRYLQGSLLAFMTMLALALPTLASSGQKVDNFVLLDHKGKAQELYYDTDARAVVLIVQGNGCQIVRSTLADYKALRDDYAERNVRVLMINSNLQDTRETIAAEAAEWGIDIPILHDSAQVIGRSLALTRTAEVLVIDPRSWEIVYRGALNNRVDYERQKNEASQRYVRDVVDKLLADEKVAFEEISSPGCIVNFPERDGNKISYSETIAPLLQRNCVACHVEGGIAPWAMSEYRMVLGFAPMMREVVRTKRMPPWHADPAVGHWEEAGGISDEEVATLISWIEAGAPRGDGPDPLQSIEPPISRWALGEPDLILDVPAFEVPATGVIDYEFPVIENPLDHDVWVVAAAIVPGDGKAVHHVLLGSADTPPEKGEEESVFQNYIMGYAPGNESSYMPEGTGVFVPAGGVYLTQMHYTPYGKASTDVTRIGLYFAKEKPANFLRQEVVLNPMLEIPPHAEAYEVHAYFEFWEDAVIYSLVPHSHYRGRASTFELVYPDGATELVLSVPNYDFNWQRTYKFAEPKTVPAGTRIIHRTVYDNSNKNPGNPDPEKTVNWGLQSQEEMLYGSVSYAWLNETSDTPTHDKLRADTHQFIGFADADMDGKVSKDEMPERMREGIGWKWFFVDKNKDGGLDAGELEAMFKKARDS